MEPLFFLQNTWYVLLGVLLIGYSILDGFDLGVGCLVPFLAKNDADKRMLFNAIGRFWDGNEVWLLTGGGALFAAFPHVYATVFSGFYLALMLVLFALIFRAVALEFWSYDEKRKKLWEWAFVVGSFLPALLYGVALGNVVAGIPLNDKMEFTGNFFTLLRPFPLAVGLLGLAAILLQGSTYAAMKTTGSLQENARKMARKIGAIFIVIADNSGTIKAVFPIAEHGDLLGRSAPTRQGRHRLRDPRTVSPSERRHHRIPGSPALACALNSVRSPHLQPSPSVDYGPR